MDGRHRTTNDGVAPKGTARTPRYLSRFAAVMDTVFTVPGTRFRFGLDPLIGLIPGVGDLMGGGLSAYILYVAAREGVSKVILLRMLANVAIDTVLGSIPLFGDLFDAWWKANTRNLQLLERNRASPENTRRASTGFVVLLLCAVALLVIGAVWLVFTLLGALLSAAGVS